MAELRRCRCAQLTACAARNLFQCSGNAIGVARVLHRAGIGKKFTLPAHRRLNDASEEVPNNSNNEERNTNSKPNSRTVVLVARWAGIHLRPNQNSTNHRNRKDSTKPRHQAHIEPRVSMKDMAEFMRHDPLQFIT